MISNHPFSGDSSVLFTFFDLIEIDKSSIKRTKKQTNIVIDSTASKQASKQTKLLCRKWLPLHTSFYAHCSLDLLQAPENTCNCKLDSITLRTIAKRCQCPLNFEIMTSDTTRVLCSKGTGVFVCGSSGPFRDPEADGLLHNG